jgi:mannose-6-phosphate isomerase-like protein (cupin superfamily)
MHAVSRLIKRSLRIKQATVINRPGLRGSQIMIIAVALLLAFGAGVLFARSIKPATADDEPPMVAQIVNVPALNGPDLGAPLPGAALRYTKIFATSKTGTVQVQTGETAKHFHAVTNEIQYVVEGMGTMWLGDKQVDIKPGDLIIIPKGTPHGGTHATSGTFKLVAVKTPPQAKEDYHVIP